MPIGYVIDRGLQVVFMRAWGRVSNGVLTAQASALRGDALMDSEFSLLVDLREVTEHGMTLDFLPRFPTSFSKRARRAIVVGDVYGLAVAQAYCGWVAGGSGVVTRSVQEALAWLGLPPETCLPERLAATFESPE